jgi:hypothetical protein
MLCSAPGIISLEEIKKTALDKAEKCFPGRKFDSVDKPISYWDGVMMAEGRNKGAVLQLLLASAAEGCELPNDGEPGKDYELVGDYKSIVFVDDGKSNIEKMRAALPDDDWVTIVHYTKLDKAVKEFQASEDRKIKADKSWLALQGVICNEVDQYCPVNSGAAGAAP